MASGRTLRSRDFTREHTLTGAVWQGGGNPPDSQRPGDDGKDDFLCRLLVCLLRNDRFLNYLKQHEVPVDGLKECVEKVCRNDSRSSGRALRNFFDSQPDVRRAVEDLVEALQRKTGGDDTR